MTEKEDLLYRICRMFHKCPWYKRIFNKYPDFDSFETFDSGVGKTTYVKCKTCGKIYDITDYDLW